ncbi:right-handed parallel beta-helix repeat-containing protein [Alkalihalobacillus sp. BA299]|uniref:right-handed parallel beta-helix repeat-containing protein n=1 Tax=Alkalihalobacillus sp. BA299 TaxID=2815938 RepID=UPI001AD9B711|nr:right-handed parallel beta-helix repeat-containing protein [Alkalihalobacillus sp. BA299]
MRVIRVPQDEPTIQEAVNSARAGNIIIIDEGVFDEEVSIFTDNLLIVGKGSKTVLQSPTCEEGTGFQVNANGVQIHEMAIRNFDIGIQVIDSSDIVLGNLKLENNVGTGIEILFSSNIKLVKVEVIRSRVGLFPFVVTDFSMEGSKLFQNFIAQLDAVISRATVTNTEYRDNFLGFLPGPGNNYHVNFCKFIGNEFIGGSFFAIDDGSIKNCIAEDNSFSAGLGSSLGTRNHIAFNQSRRNGLSGIRLGSEDSSVVEFNEATNNGQGMPTLSGGGIFLRFTNNTVVRFNTAKNNIPADIIVIDGSGNTFIGNDFDTFRETPTDPI